jgi:hypothetical protein
MIIAAAMILAVGFPVAKISLNPLRRSEDGIREWLLQQAPLGSNREQVLVVVAKRGWKMHPEYRGRFINKTIPVGGFGAELGTYMGWTDTKVDAYWKFGAEDKLVEVYVNKWREGF